MEWAVHVPTGDIFVRDPKIGKWQYGQDAAKWNRWGRERVFGDQATNAQANEIAARRPFLEKQRASTATMGFGKIPPTKGQQVDAALRSDPQLDEVLSRRKQEPSRFEKAVDKMRKRWENTHAFWVRRPELNDYPRLKVGSRKRMQLVEDAKDMADRKLAVIRQPFGFRKTGEAPGVAEQQFHKYVQLQDMHDTSLRPVGSPGEIETAGKALGDELDKLEGLKGAALTRQLARVEKAQNAMDMLTRPTPVPLGRTTEQLQRSLDELDQKLLPEARRAIDNHNVVMRNYLVDNVARGRLNPELLKSTDTYYPHEVYQFDGELADYLGMLQPELREPYTGWTRRREGSERTLNFDYDDAIRGYVMRNELANGYDDFAHEYLPVYDILPELKADPEKWARNFTETSGKVMPLSGLYHGMQKEIDGTKYTVIKWKRFGWAGGTPPTELAQAAMDSLMREMPGATKDTYMVPSVTAPIYEQGSWRTDFNTLQAYMTGYVPWWKKGVILWGGAGTRVANSFGDTVQGVFEDMGYLPNLLRIPTIRSIINEDAERTPRLQKLRDILQKERAMEGTTFYGPEGRQIAREMYNMTPAQRRAYWANPKNWWHIFDKVTNTMELWPRVAMALHKYETEYEQGKPITSKVQQAFLDRLPPEEALGQVTRNTFVDPQDVSEPYQKILRRGLMPFVTWYQKTLGYSTRYVWNHPFEAAAKIGLPFLGMWMWNNNEDNRDTERNLSWWQKHTAHMIVSWPTKDDPKHKTVLLFPTGVDLMLDLVQVPELEERLARWKKDGESNPINFTGWGDLGQTALRMLALNPISTVANMADIGQIVEGAWSGRDPFDGHQIVPPQLANDPWRSSKVKAFWIAQKVIPFLDRFQTYAHRNLMKDPTWLDRMMPGGGGGPMRKPVQDAIADWLDPTRTTWYDVTPDMMRPFLDAAQQHTSDYNVATYDLQDALGQLLEGKRGPLDEWMNTWAGKTVPGKVDTLAAISRMYTDQLENAPDDAHRAALQKTLRIIKLAQEYQMFKAQPAPSRLQSVIEALKAEKGQIGEMHKPGLFGEAFEPLR